MARKSHGGRVRVESRVWTIEEARDRLDELLRAAVEHGPQEIHDERHDLFFRVEKTGLKQSGRELHLKTGG